MTHETCLELLSCWRDGELPAAEADAVSAHAASCAECAFLLAGLERLGRGLFQPAPDSEMFVSSVMARLEPRLEAKPAAAGPGWRSWLTPALGFAFAASLVVYSIPWPQAESFPDEMLQTSSLQSLSAWSFPGATSAADLSSPADALGDAQ